MRNNEAQTLTADDVSTCVWCGHLHYVSRTDAYIECPIADDGCSCTAEERREYAVKS